MPARDTAQTPPECLPELIRPDTWLAQAWLHAQRHAGEPYIGRFAPSPSGKLHQGSLIAALASYLHAHWHGGTWLVRMEDVDQSRCTRVTGEHQLATLRALGFQFAEPVMWQSERFTAYRVAFERLRAQRRVYPCVCTRSQIAEQQAVLGVPHYPQTCRHGVSNDTPIRSWRFAVNDQVIEWTDEWTDKWGQISTERLADSVGDFVVRRGAEDTDDWAYQLAVVVDDAAQEVTHVVRGADLFDSTARQIALQRALNYATPQYSHVPLLTNAQGEKLSKSEQAPELDALHPLAALQHAWRFLGGVALDCTDITTFWQCVLDRDGLNSPRRSSQD